jgi:hypothetical protein
MRSFCCARSNPARALLGLLVWSLSANAPVGSIVEIAHTGQRIY